MMRSDDDLRTDAAAVAEYLRKHPAFFEDYADLVADIYVPHPHGGHAIPIAERQMLTLRERNDEVEAKLRDLERRTRELVAFAAQNDSTSEKLHRATLALFSAGDLETTLGVLEQSLVDDFAVPAVAMRLWGRVPEQSYLPELAATSPELREYAASLGEPYRGPKAPFDAADWFEQDPGTFSSYAFLALRTQRTFGLLGLASPDAHRFSHDMGTMYLIRMAELASVAIARFLPGS